MAQETGFEQLRGVSQIEIKNGYAQIHVSRLEEPLSQSRLLVLRALAEADLSLDFLKFTPSGLSCLISESMSKVAEESLNNVGVHYSVKLNRSVVIVFAVNMRDEEGLVARIVRQAIASGARIEHITDTHDRVPIVVHSQDAEMLKKTLESFSEYHKVNN